jgi:hypothetical protein
MFLDLSFYNFTGQIPEVVCTNLGKLETLNHSTNSLQGSLSSNISKLSNLKNISLNNQLSGQIPESIGSISGLQIVELFSNSFQGNIPSSTGQLRPTQRSLLSLAFVLTSPTWQCYSKSTNSICFLEIFLQKLGN